MIRPVVILLLALLAACDPDPAGKAPTPAAYDPDAHAHFCGMTLGEHPGPKAQILIGGSDAPIWFASVRDAFAFTQLPEEPKDIRAFYVTDMASAPSWRDAGRGRWIEARTATYVIGAAVTGGMGRTDMVPFADHDAALAFAAKRKGRIATFDEVRRMNMLTDDDHESRS